MQTVLFSNPFHGRKVNFASEKRDFWDLTPSNSSKLVVLVNSYHIVQVIALDTKLLYLLLSGLVLELNIQQQEYIGAFAEEAGVRIDISNQGEMAFPREKGLSAPPGFATSIGMRKVML